MILIIEVSSVQSLDSITTLHGVYLQSTGLTATNVAYLRQSIDVAAVYAVDSSSGSVTCICKGIAADTARIDKVLKGVDDRAEHGIDASATKVVQNEHELVQAMHNCHGAAEVFYIAVQT